MVLMINGGASNGVSLEYDPSKLSGGGYLYVWDFYEIVDINDIFSTKFEKLQINFINYKQFYFYSNCN